MPQIQLGAIDYAILIVYFAFVLGIGVVLRRYVKSSEDFFLSGRSIPTWIAGLASLSANLGAQEVIGMAASGAKYGMMTSHFYWVGAIPAMVFVGIFMMPFYYGSRARSVPEYLRLRFDEKTRGFNAISFALMTVLSPGISMYALAKLLELVLGWNFHTSVLLSAVIVLVYIFLGGIVTAVFPVLARMGRLDGEESRGLMRRSLTVSLVCSVPFAVVALLQHERVMTAVYGAEYAPGATALAVLMAALPVLFLTNLFGHLLGAVGQQRLVLRIAATNLLVNVVFNLLLIPALGPLGAAIATLATELCGLAALSLLLRSRASAIVAWGSVGRVALAALALGVALWLAAALPLAATLARERE